MIMTCPQSRYDPKPSGILPSLTSVPESRFFCYPLGLVFLLLGLYLPTPLRDILQQAAAFLEAGR